MDGYYQIMRQRLRDRTRCLPRSDGTLYRDGAAIGTVGGIRYTKRLGGYTIGLPGQIADQPDGEYLMVLYPDDPPKAKEGDTLTIGEERYQILRVRDYLAYKTYRMEAMA